jgi:hypothetical protein
MVWLSSRFWLQLLIYRRIGGRQRAAHKAHRSGSRLGRIAETEFGPSFDMEIQLRQPNNSTGEPYITMKIAKETWIILAIGLADLATTILFIQHRGAEEANPLFKRYWEMGLAVFVGAKIALLVGPLSILEWARTRNPKFVNSALRGAIAAYLVMYGIGFYKLNYGARPEYEFATPAALEYQIPRRLAERMRGGRNAVRVGSLLTGAEAASAHVTVY